MKEAAGRPLNAADAESSFRYSFRSEPVKLDFVTQQVGRTARYARQILSF